MSTVKQTDSTDPAVQNPFVFIVGCPRSGTTLLKRMIDTHPEVAFPLESHWITEYYEERRGLTPDGYVKPRLLHHLFNHRKFIKLRFSREEIESLIPTDGAISYTDFVAAIYDFYGRRKAKSWWATKRHRMDDRFRSSIPCGRNPSSSTLFATAATLGFRF